MALHRGAHEWEADGLKCLKSRDWHVTWMAHGGVVCSLLEVISTASALNCKATQTFDRTGKNWDLMSGGVQWFADGSRHRSEEQSAMNKFQ